jgi:hypothetical protein
LTYKPKPVYEVGFIREKGKATARTCSGARKPVALCSGKDWSFYGRSNSGLGGFFSLAMDSQVFLDELVCLPLIGGGETILMSILLIRPVADLSDPVSLLQDAGMQVCNSFSGCRNADFRMQE